MKNLKYLLFIVALFFLGCSKSSNEINPIDEYDEIKMKITIGKEIINIGSGGNKKIEYRNFNSTLPRMEISGSDNKSNRIYFTFDATKLISDSKNLTITEGYNFVALETNINNLLEEWSDDPTNKSSTINIVEFEYKTNGKIKGICDIQLVGESLSNKGKIINAKIEFSGIYKAN